MIDSGPQSGLGTGHLPAQGPYYIFVEFHSDSHSLMILPSFLANQWRLVSLRQLQRCLSGTPNSFCYDEAMRNRLSLFVVFCSFLSLCQASFGQGATGTLDVTARIAPTGARPEPVRQFTFYILTKSYGEILKEAAEQ